MIFANLEEADACSWEGCLLPITADCALCRSFSDCPDILCVNGDEDVRDGEGDVCEFQSVRMASDSAVGWLQSCGLMESVSG